MNILVVTQYFYPETFRINTLCKELVIRGHQVTVLTGYPQYPQGEIYDGYGFDIPYEKQWYGITICRVPVRARGKNALSMILNCWDFVHEGKKWVRKCKEKYDVVYVFEVSPVTVGLPAGAYKKKFHVPVLFNVQDLWPENVEVILGIHNKIVLGGINHVVDKIYRFSDCILCSSKGFVNAISARGVPAQKLVFWPQFCEKPDFENMKRPDQYDEEYFNIVFAGNLGDAQGLDLMVETAHKLKNEKIHWYLVGDGRAKNRLQKLVEEYNLNEEIFFVGKVSENEANCYVRYANCAYLSFQNNSLFDKTIPAKLQTYLACGAPILAAAGGESARIIEEAHCGIATPAERNALVAGVKKIANLSQEEIENMRKNASSYYENNYTLKKLVSELEGLMEKVQ